MKIFISTSTLFLLFTLFSIVVCAQTQSNSVETQSRSPICSYELFKKAEHSYKRRKYSSEIKAEQDLKEIVQNCDYSFYWSYQAEKYLKIVQEELAERHFIIASYYWDKFKDGKITSVNGVVSRLKIIVEKYPNYSQIDKVKELLDEANKEKTLMTESITDYFQ